MLSIWGSSIQGKEVSIGVPEGYGVEVQFERSTRSEQFSLVLYLHQFIEMLYFIFKIHQKRNFKSPGEQDPDQHSHHLMTGIQSLRSSRSLNLKSKYGQSRETFKRGLFLWFSFLDRKRVVKWLTRGNYTAMYLLRWIVKLTITSDLCSTKKEASALHTSHSNCWILQIWVILIDWTTMKNLTSKNIVNVPRRCLCTAGRPLYFEWVAISDMH